MFIFHWCYAAKRLLWGAAPTPAIERRSLDPVFGEKISVFQTNEALAWMAANTGVLGQLHHSYFYRSFVLFRQIFFFSCALLLLFFFQTRTAFPCSPATYKPFEQFLPSHQSQNVPTNALITIQYNPLFPWNPSLDQLRASLRLVRSEAPLPNEVDATLESLAQGMIYRFRPTQPLQPETRYTVRTKLNSECLGSFSPMNCDLSEERDLFTFQTGKTPQTAYPPFPGIQKASIYCNSYDNSCGKGCYFDYSVLITPPPTSNPHRRFHLYHADNLRIPIAWYLSAFVDPNSPNQPYLLGPGIRMQKRNAYIVRAVEITGHIDANTHAVEAIANGCACDADKGSSPPIPAGCSIAPTLSWCWAWIWVGLGWVRRKKRA